MLREINVHLLPQLVEPSELDGCRVVVIDVLRATTTIVQALAAGASCVWPCLTVEDARSKAQDLAELGPQPLLAGERHCLRVEGFDLGNSPLEYKTSTVGGRGIVFTTTNGTAAMLHARMANRVFVGSFTNLSAVTRLIRSETSGSPVHLICSGTNGSVTREDVLLAGALVEQVVGATADEVALNDQSRIAMSAWRGLSGPDANRLAATFAQTLGGSNLLKIGNESDLREAAQVDRWNVVPEFLLSESRIVRAADSV